ISIRKQNRHRSGHVYTIIYHLSIADLCVTFWCILGEAFWHYRMLVKIRCIFLSEDLRGKALWSQINLFGS
ncbi:unnamed protein product, partial [Allacma fusca]